MPVTLSAMTKRTDIRLLIALVAAFIVWRISVELMPILLALVLGLAAGGVAWLATRPRIAPPAP